MTDRAELLEAALDSRSDGIALLGATNEIVFWNRAAEAITGHTGLEILHRPSPAALEQLLNPAIEPESATGSMPQARGFIVEAEHKLGHKVQVVAQRVILRDPLGGRIGTAVFFHPAQSLDALPHGETGEDEREELEASQAELEERLTSEYDDYVRGGQPLGVVWISVDQAQELRRSHGVAACRGMLEKLRRAVAQGLRPGEQMGRWGDEEFLVVAHERSAEMLAKHAQTLTGLARTADFRWWGDRVSITVSIGAAQAADAAEENLAQLLERAREAMAASNHAGGNRATLAAWRQECSPS
jgi:diguanylate cyclase (GGDEF)-like protein/PAS domain S-box-containing protein